MPRRRRIGGGVGDIEGEACATCTMHATHATYVTYAKPSSWQQKRSVGACATWYGPRRCARARVRACAQLSAYMRPRLRDYRRIDGWTIQCLSMS